MYRAAVARAPRFPDPRRDAAILSADKLAWVALEARYGKRAIIRHHQRIFDALTTLRNDAMKGANDGRAGL